MNEEVKAGIDMLQAELGEERVFVATPATFAEKVVSGDVQVCILTMDSGDHDEARQAAEAANAAVAARPGICLLFGINGLMDDARELDQIPEAAATLRWFFMHLRRATFHRFTAEHQALMLVVAGLGARHGTQLYVPTELMKVEGEVL